MKLKYSYKLQKTAGIMTPKGFQPIGVFEEREREGDEVKNTIKLLDDIPVELLTLLKSMPQLIEFQEQRLPGEGMVIIPELTDKK